MKSKLILSVVDQALVSAFNFGLNLYLIKVWSVEEYGLFAIVSATAIFATMIQNAVINTPLSVHLPVASTAIDKALLLRVFSATNFSLTILVMIASWGGLLLWLGASQMALVIGASAYICTQFLREYYRSLLAVEGRLGILLLSDAAYVGLAITGLGYLHWREQDRMISMLLTILGGTGLIAMLHHLVPIRVPSLRNLPAEMISVFSKQMPEIRWSLLGVLTTDIQNRGYLFVAAAVFGPASVAQLQAGRIFFGPLNLLTSAWARVVRPQLAAQIGEGKLGLFSSVLKRAVWSFAIFNIFFLLALSLAWPYLSALVFSEKYEGLGILVAGWGVANLLFQIRACLGTGVQALRRFRDLTLATISGAIVSAALLALACMAEEAKWLIASVIGGECVAVIVVIRILRRYLPLDATTK